jgi:hypothetical protein
MKTSATKMPTGRYYEYGTNLHGLNKDNVQCPTVCRWREDHAAEKQRKVKQATLEATPRLSDQGPRLARSKPEA